MSFTLGGNLITTLQYDCPQYGVAAASVEIDGPVELSGVQVLTMGDLSCVGTILQGGGVAGRGRYEWTAGYGGWRKTIPARGYDSSVGVLRSTVLKDAAQACGESLALGISELRLGIAPQPGYVRLAGPAWDTMDGLAVPWYVAPSGMTRVEERPAGVAPAANVVVESWEREDGLRVVVPSGEQIAGFLPGRIFEGETISKLSVCAREGEPIRLTILTDPSHELRALFDRMHAQQSEAQRFLGRYRYRVTARTGTLYGLVPVDPSLGLPPLEKRDLWPGAAGHDAQLPTGYQVIVSFLDGRASEPVIDGFVRLGDRPNLPEIVSFDASDRVNLGDAGQLVARETDPVKGLIVSATQDSSTGTVAITIQDSATPPQAILLLVTAAGLVSVVGAPLTPEPPKIISVSVIDTPAQAKVYA